MKDHWLENAHHVLTESMGGIMTPEFAVMHYTVGSAKSAINVFKGPAKVSAHLVIGRSGTVTQMVPFNRVAWHAGRSSWENRAGCNGFTIGIEFENVGPLTYGNGEFRDVYSRPYEGSVHEEQVGRYKYWAAYTAPQIEAGARVTTTLFNHYSSLRGVLEHSDIAPGRKIDSGPAFPIALFESIAEDHGNRDSDGADTYSTTVNLNIRDAPRGKLLATLPKGTKVVPKRSEGSWWLVSPENGTSEGWVYSKYLRLV